MSFCSTYPLATLNPLVLACQKQASRQAARRYMASRRPFTLLTTTQITNLHHRFIYTRPPLHPQLLDSASQAPLRTLYYGESHQQNVFYLAARLAINLMMNHPFLDGNKRTACIATGVFLKANGWSLTPSARGLDVNGKGVLMLEDAFVACVTRHLTVDEFSIYLRASSKKRPARAA